MKITPLKFILFVVLLAGLLFLKQDNTSVVQTDALNKQDVILAFGDSLTYGTGAPSLSYPVQLERLLQRKVVNAGNSGELSSIGLSRLPSLLKKFHPSLVILCHGGNDLIQKKSKELLKNNLRQMIQLSKASGAHVLLIGVPNFKVIRFSTESLYAELAEEENVLYEGKVLATIENNSALKSDRIHPNAKGYSLMAKTFTHVLKDSGLVKE